MNKKKSARRIEKELCYERRKTAGSCKAHFEQNRPLDRAGLRAVVALHSGVPDHRSGSVLGMAPENQKAFGMGWGSGGFRNHRGSCHSPVPLVLTFRDWPAFRTNLKQRIALDSKWHRGHRSALHADVHGHQGLHEPSRDTGEGQKRRWWALAQDQAQRAERKGDVPLRRCTHLRFDQPQLVGGAGSAVVSLVTHRYLHGVLPDHRHPAFRGCDRHRKDQDPQDEFAKGVLRQPQLRKLQGAG